MSTEIAFKHHSCIRTQWQKNEPNTKKWVFAKAWMSPNSLMGPVCLPIFLISDRLLSPAGIDTIWWQVEVPPLFRIYRLAVTEELVGPHEKPIEQWGPFNDALDKGMEQALWFVPRTNRKANATGTACRFGIGPASGIIPVPGFMPGIDPLSGHLKTRNRVFD